MENIQTLYRYVHKNTQGDNGHITGGRYCKMYKIRPTKKVIVLKECKTRECQNKLQKVQLKEKGKEKDHVKDGGMRLKKV